MKIAILGASRGLGAALVHHIQQESPQSSLLLSSRREDELKKIAGRQDWIFPADYSQPAGQDELIRRLCEFKPAQLFYIAGGGPFGPYQKKEWKDHKWSFEVNLLFPARLLHVLLSEKIFFDELKKVVLIGSAIAGQKPDPNAGSYAGGKHGLRGLVTSLQGETPYFDLRLYEPGYMDTAMLPPHAWPRQQGLAKSPHEEARKLWHWSQSSVD